MARASTERIERALIGAVFLSLLVSAAAIFAPVSGDVGWFLQSSGSIFVYLFAGVYLLVRASHGDAGTRDWRWIASTMLIMSVATLAYYFEMQVRFGDEYAEGGDIIWFFAYAPAVVGVARLARRGSRRAPHIAMIEAFLVSAGTFAIAAAGMSMALHASSEVGGIEAGVNIASVFFDMLLVSVTLGSAQRSKWRPPVSVQLLFAASALFAIFDAMYAVQMVNDTYVWGSVLDLGWPLSAFLFVVAAYVRVPRAVPETPSTSNALLLPPAVMTLAAAIVLSLPAQGGIMWVARGAGLVTVALAVTRLYLAVRAATVMAEELRAARIDTLTGLPNRRAFLALDDVEMVDSVLIELDLDGLSEINATFDTPIGDGLLIAVAERIRSGIRIDDYLARMGEDEFGILLRNATASSAGRIAENLVASLEADIRVEGHALTVSACAGVSSPGTHGATASQLLSEAAGALQEAQRMGTGIVRTFAGLTGDRSQDRLRTRNRIKEILRHGGAEFVPYFQPIIDTRDGSVLAVEALIRWHRDGRVILPGEFLAEVEGSGSMRMLTAHVMREGMRALRGAGLDYAVAVNVTPDLVDGELHDMVFDAVFGSRSRLDQLIIEVTEHAIMRDPAQTAAVLGELRSEGLRVLLDDFGTGWSGLSSLRDLVVDGIKMDGSFIANMWRDDTTTKIVQGVARVAEDLGVLVVYEGVEDPHHVARFRRQRQGYLQGFGVARPMPVEELVRWAQLQREFDAAGRPIR